MIKVDNEVLKNAYIQQYAISNIFTSPKMASYMELLFIKRNDYICKEGEKLDYLLFFLEGKAKVYISLGNGRRLLLCFYDSFQVLGDMEVICGEVASTNIQVIEDTYCIGVPLEMIRKHALSDAEFLKFICSGLGKKLGRCSHNSSINLLYPLENRLASYIFATSKWEYQGEMTVLKFDANLSEVAELLGTSYRHLLRVIDKFCVAEYIERKTHYFEVKAFEAIKKLAVEVYL